MSGLISIHSKTVRIGLFNLFITCFIFGFVRPAVAQYTTAAGSPTFSTALPVEMGFTNVANGNLHLEIPLASFPQRGKLAYNARLVYDSLIWTINSNQWSPTNIPNSMGGWRLITGGEPGSVTNTEFNDFCDTPPPLNSRTDHVAFVWTSPDGTTHTFPIFTRRDRTVCAEDIPSDTEFADDSSGYQMSVTNYIDATVYAPDGTQVFPKVEDTNGNFFSVDGSGNIVDTLNRTPITVSTVGSTITYGVLNTSGTRTNITVTTTTVSANTLFGQTGVAECTTCTMTAIQSIAFDDGSSYSFTYDSGTASGHFGLLTSMTLRTGGIINYGYTTFADGLGNHSRWLNSKGQGSGTPWTYTPAALGSSQKVTVKDCLNNTYVYNFSLNNGAWANSETYTDVTLGLLATIVTSWDTSNSCPPNSGCTSGAAFVRRVTSSVQLPGGLTKNTAYSYASPTTGQVSEIDESDYSTGTAPILKKTLLSYAPLGNILTSPHQITVKDGSNNVISQTTYGYDEATSSPTSAPQHAAVTASRGNITTLTQLVTGTTTLGSTFTYDDTGNVLTSTDPGANVTAFDYTDSFSDATGTGTLAYVTKVTLPPTSGVSHITNTQYEFNTGLRVSTTDLNGNPTTFTYDPQARPLTINAPDGGQVSFSYPSITSLVSSHAITGTQTFSDTTNFDAYGRVSKQQRTSENPADPPTVDTTYDGNGRVHSVSNPHRSGSNLTDGTTTYAYDALGRPILTTEEDGNTIARSYSANCVTVTDEASKKRKMCADGLGRTTSTFEPDSTLAFNWETDIAYDALDNILGITQKGGAASSQWRTRTFAYDGLSRMTQSFMPESGYTTLAYTTTGGARCAGDPSAACRITDARGITTTLAYDALSRLTGKTYSDTTHSVSYAYDQATVGTLTISNPNGLRTSMTDASGSTAWSYDKMGRVATRQQTIGALTKSIIFTYNLDGTIATVLYPSGRTYTYTYNNADQISTLKDVANNINFFSSPQYAPPGMLTSAVHGAVTGWNAITLTNTYNNRLQPTQYQAVSPLPSTLLNLSYSYDQGGGINNGSVMKITNGRDSSRTVSYTYDQLNRLASAQTASTWGDAYVYDAWGNLLQKNVTVGTAESMALTVNTNNQITTPAFTYDASGNVTWDTSHALNYDAGGHMTPVSGETYTYDGDDRRVLKSDGTVYWVDDQLRPRSVGTTGGSITRDYIFLGSQRIAMVPLSSGNPYYYLSDHLGSTAVIASGDGKTIQWEADYFPFGAVRQVFTSTVGNNYEFTGYENDSETGYNYANARFDAGRWGRFLSADSYSGSADITNPQSLNRYSYVGNNPTGFVDPSGLTTVCTLNGPHTNVHMCVSIGCNSSIDGQDCAGDSGGGGGGGGIGNIIGSILNGGGLVGSVPGACLFAGACPTLPIPSILASLPGMSQPGCDFGPCDDSGNQLGSDFVPGVHLWEYGHWCGPGGAGKPINAIDEQCMIHDKCYDAIGIDWNSMSSDANFQKLSPAQQGKALACNQQLCSGLDAITPPKWNVSQWSAKLEISKYFHGHVPKGAQCK